MIKNLVVGAGISGATIAYLIAEIKKEKVLIIDKRNHVAGNIYDYKNDETNITIQKYGPHFFHTNNDNVWQFLSKFTKWHYHNHKVKAYINNSFISIPFSLNSLYEYFSKEEATAIEKELIKEYGYNQKISILELSKTKNEKIKYISNFIYENIYKNYTIKQWGISPDEIDKSIISRIPIYINHNIHYFSDKYQAIPIEGYTKLIENILNHKNITIKLNTNFKEINSSFDKIFYSGSIDEFFNYEFGVLPYRSLEFENKLINQEYYQATSVVNYPNDFNYTRTTEHKRILNEKSKKTIITLEYPKQFEINKNERYYPIINHKNCDLYKKYFEKSKKINGLYFIGRLGQYKYFDIDMAIENTFELFNNL